MNDLDIFFNKTVPASKPTLLITDVYTLKQRMDKDVTIKHVIDECNYQGLDTVAVFKIATYDENDPNYGMTGNMYFVSSASEIHLHKNGIPNKIYLEIPMVSYQFNVHEYFSVVWGFGWIFDVIWDCENLRPQHDVEKIKPCCNFDAKIKHASEKSPNRRSCITLEIIKDSV